MHEHAGETSQCVAVHVRDYVETAHCTTAVCKLVTQQGSEHTALRHSNVENQQGKALAVRSY